MDTIKSLGFEKENKKQTNSTKDHAIMDDGYRDLSGYKEIQFSSLPFPFGQAVARMFLPGVMFIAQKTLASTMK